MPSAASSPVPPRCLTIDVEEYFHIEAAHGVVPRQQWEAMPTRVERSMDALLTLFADLGCRATLFWLGWSARRHPALVRRCVEAGHEIACHGQMHDRLHRLDRRTMAQDVREARALLEDLSGQAVRGYRAPTWSITRQTAWAIDVLMDVGLTYDASIFPVRHHWYGVPDAPAHPYFVRGETHGALLEVPPLIWRAGGRNLPAAGGGYFRLLPTAILRRGLHQAASRNRPAVLYFHPWEFDPDQPRLPLSTTGRLRTYTGLRTALPRLRRLLAATGPWTPIADHLDTLRQAAASCPTFALAA